MQRSLSEQDAQFQATVREFMTTQVPQELRTKVAAGVELTKEELVRAQQILNAGGYAVPHWPLEWGGRTGRPCSDTSGRPRCRRPLSRRCCRST